MRRVTAIGAAFILLSACQGGHTAALSEAERTWLAQGDAARSLGRYEEAEAAYAKAATLSKGPVRAHLELAGIYRRKSDHEAAQRILGQAYNLNPHNTEVAKGYAQSLLLAGNAEQAADITARALRDTPEDVRLLNLRGVALDRMGRHAEAQRLYIQAMTHANTAEDREMTANNHALSLVASRDYDAAIRIVETHVPDARGRTASRQLLALIHGVKGDTDKAYEFGLRDLSLKQVNENLRFYNQLREGAIPVESLFLPVE